MSTNSLQNLLSAVFQCVTGTGSQEYWIFWGVFTNRRRVYLTDAGNENFGAMCAEQRSLSVVRFTFSLRCFSKLSTGNLNVDTILLAGLQSM